MQNVNGDSHLLLFCVVAAPISHYLLILVDNLQQML